MTARLERLVPEAEKAIGEVVKSAQPHVPSAGSGIEWPVLDQAVNGTVQAQLDSAACGPACLAIAQVGVHFVVVDGFDASGHLLIRDPWYEPGLSRGSNGGSSYRVSLRTFIQEWHAVAIYRR